VQEFLAINDMTVIIHPLYFQDLAPHEFLFPKFKLVLSGKSSDDVSIMKEKSEFRTQYFHT